MGAAAEMWLCHTFLLP